MEEASGRGNKFFDPLCDSFLSPEFNDSVLKIDKKDFEQSAKTLGELALSPWKDSELGLQIHAASVYACEPSIRRIISGKEHDQELAREVLINLNALMGRLMSSHVQVKIDTYKQNNTNTMPHAHAVETAILTGIWWLIANGRFAPTSYALPVVSALEKESGNVRSFYKTRTDLRFVNGGENNAKIDIQVKSMRPQRPYSPHNTSIPGKIKRPYAPWIPIVTPLDFISNGEVVGYKSVEEEGGIKHYPKLEGYDGSLERLYKAISENKEDQLDYSYFKFSSRLAKVGHLHEKWWVDNGQEPELAINY